MGRRGALRRPCGCCWHQGMRLARQLQAAREAPTHLIICSAARMSAAPSRCSTTSPRTSSGSQWRVRWCRPWGGGGSPSPAGPAPPGAAAPGWPSGAATFRPPAAAAAAACGVGCCGLGDGAACAGAASGGRCSAVSAVSSGACIGRPTHPCLPACSAGVQAAKAGPVPSSQGAIPSAECRSLDLAPVLPGRRGGRLCGLPRPWAIQLGPVSSWGYWVGRCRAIKSCSNRAQALHSLHPGTLSGV